MALRCDISVIIPALDDADELRRTLDGYAVQELGEIAAEIVVVGHAIGGSLSRYADGRVGQLNLLVADRHGGGLAAARDAGAAAAAGEIVLFVGDDCRPSRSDFVASHVQAHRGGEGSLAVTGRIARDPSLEGTPLTDWLERTGAVAAGVPLGACKLSTPRFDAANASLPRRELLEVGGHDLRFDGHVLGDRELALRLADRGVRFVHRSDLRVDRTRADLRVDRTRDPGDVRESLGRAEAAGRAARLLNRVQPHRRPLPAPKPQRRHARAVRGLAPLTSLARFSRWLPNGVRDRWLELAHGAAFASGYARDGLPDLPVGHGLGSSPASAAPRRPPVSVVVPFRGDESEAAEAIDRLRRVRLRDGDELIVVDNTDRQLVATSAAAATLTVVRASQKRSSYYARNAGVSRARNDWLLFVDGDCLPSPDILDTFLEEPVAADVGAVAGGVVGASEQRTTVTEWARSRNHLRQYRHLLHPYRPYGATCNLLVRREALAQIGGFHEVRSAADADLCWRIIEAGWRLDYGERAGVEHWHRERVAGMARQIVTHGAGLAWLNRRYPGAHPRPRMLRPLARCARGAAIGVIRRHPRRALFASLDAVAVLSHAAGRLLGNAPRPGAGGLAAADRVPRPHAPLRLVLLLDQFPELSETFVAEEVHALRRAGHEVRIEAAARAARPNGALAHSLEASYREDDGFARKLADLAWLVWRHPLGCARDRRDRRRWRADEPVRRLAALAPVARRLARGEERHIHAHFAASAALDALRLSRLLDLPYSVTAHAYDIFQRPANLREKLEAAALVTTGCAYNVEHLSRLVDPRAGARVHEVVMGVDTTRFRRSAPYPGGRSVIAVGRLIEKKGFEYLIDAVARLRGDDGVDRLVIVGEGPLRSALERHSLERGLDGVVELVGARTPDAVRGLLEEADLLAMPCVVAADGDRDSMPVVVKEALAMAVPVVCTHEVGLPELVRAEWGRLVPPRDAGALAEAIAELLALPAATRAEMGRAGRAFVAERCDVDRETARLAELIARGDGR